MKTDALMTSSNVFHRELNMRFLDSISNENTKIVTGTFFRYSEPLEILYKKIYLHLI